MATVTIITHDIPPETVGVFESYDEAITFVTTHPFHPGLQHGYRFVTTESEICKCGL